jgi:two-component system NtrC family sensor kinase
MRLGLTDILYPPLESGDVLKSVRNSLDQGKRWQDWVEQESRRITGPLEQRVDELESLAVIGQSVTAQLDLDRVLTAIVDSAVEFTGAEEGSLLLIDEKTGELYMRAAKNFQDDFVRTFRLPVEDTLAGEVISSGNPAIINEDTPQKIKTAYLVHTLIYVPLRIRGEVIGVLGVDNRHSGPAFTDRHITILSAMGDYAAVAIANARLYSHTEIERGKLETILTQIADGVIVVDHDKNVILINQVAGEAFKISGNTYIGKPVDEVINSPDLIALFTNHDSAYPRRIEITLDDERTFNAQLTTIPDVGVAVTMQDVTHFKELDRIKSDFVNTVSHDLRSPLTAILGYVELIERSGDISPQQQEFVNRVQMSVHNITNLINDLLDLGRIDAGFDAQKEVIPMSVIIRYAAESRRQDVQNKNIDLKLNIPDELPSVLCNPTRMQQLMDNLIGNAVKYTPEGGNISISAQHEREQIIVQVTDNGPGIPPSEQPYIFDKFFRASSITDETPGTGLGLAIVKSIVDNHQGRVWCDSTLGEGSTFTVVLPVSTE